MIIALRFDKANQSRGIASASVPLYKPISAP